MINPRKKRAFGLAPPRPSEPEIRERGFDQLAANDLMRRRLHQKIDAYDREAKRLAFRGDYAAARDMQAAAAKLRRITRDTPIEVPAR